MQYTKKLIIQFFVLFLPVYSIIDGAIGLAHDDLFHPDALVLFGVLVIGIISLINIIIFINKLISLGWHNIPIYYKIMFVFHLILFIPSFMSWLSFFEIIPWNWNVIELIYYLVHR
ncbi:hypothetical protein [Apilactobacillus timberlakei]|uniref:Integral membrane protein n=1 Tax=Apilactobacillus timberlakei TaxID=2008380 RepID=A0ABY2YUC4_9LACO|nr:hypothetical protein [Apilactobacillus timberlakei]TPR14453.1 hypothetical protein DY052_06425 [Apilactobacillus timberlakei]TPR14668.1 hypothetical protein DYZ97_00605 [Apilactobacillus timberlakei]TPR15995.1 hypothetical protein DY048_00605 [Apilactobacillus timberlakei]TPR18735.1 hypothetical protein DY138_03725 [Apilactobacillus timberlakei]TPR21100.1 hypothetical protein DY061_03410 [Apilactobacillus timberlakei]